MALRPPPTATPPPLRCSIFKLISHREPPTYFLNEEWMYCTKKNAWLNYHAACRAEYRPFNRSKPTADAFRMTTQKSHTHTRSVAPPSISSCMADSIIIRRPKAGINHIKCGNCKSNTHTFCRSLPYFPTNGESASSSDSLSRNEPHKKTD